MGWKPGVVSLREITDANRADVERLSVATEQARYVASNTESLLEEAATPNACPWYRAVYSDEAPVGFVMISDGVPDTHPEFLGPYVLWRLMVDARWQRQGLGKAALHLVVEYVRTRPDAEHLLCSLVPGTTGSPRVVASRRRVRRCPRRRTEQGTRRTGHAPGRAVGARGTHDGGHSARVRGRWR
jgi:diamine N-acetyltransferase